MVWRHTHDDKDNWDTELFKLTEQTSITGKFMFYNIYSSDDLVVITNTG
jgi:hypothetical protein